MTTSLTTGKPQELVDTLMAKCPLVKNPLDMMALLAKAYESYVRGECPTPMALAQKYDQLTPAACRYVVQRMGWRKQRTDYLRDIGESAAAQYAEFIREKRIQVANTVVSSLEPAVQKLASEIIVSLKSTDQYRTTDARRLAEALAQLTGQLMQAAGVDGKVPAPAEKVADNSKDGGKRPWVSISASGPVTLAGGEAPAEERQAEEGDEELE